MHDSADLTWNFHLSAIVFSIRLPYSDGTQMTLGFKESHYGAPVRAVKKPDFSCIRIFSDSRPHSFSWRMICAPPGGCADWLNAWSES